MRLQHSALRQVRSLRGLLPSTTMEEFRVPEDFGDLSALQTPTQDRFCASPDLPDLRPLCDHGGVPQLNDRLDAVASRLGVDYGHGDVEDVAALAVQENFDDMFAFVR